MTDTTPNPPPSPPTAFRPAALQLSPPLRVDYTYTRRLGSRCIEPRPVRVCVHAACNTLSTIGHDRFRDGFARLGALIFLTVSRACFPRGLIQLTPGEGSQVFTICSSIYIYIYKTVYKSEIRFNPMVEKNRNVEEYDIYGIYLHGYLRDFDSGEYRVCLRRISRRSLPWFGGRNLSDQCFLEQRAARSI